MKTTAKVLICTYGQEVTLDAGNNSPLKKTKAFIQPLRAEYQSSMYQDYADPVGTEQFLYIGAPESWANNYGEGCLVKTASQDYVIIKWETVYIMNEHLYTRAVLEKQPEQS